VKLGREVDLAIIECSFPDSTTIRGEHLYPLLGGKLDSEMEAKKVILTHLYPECEGREEEMLRQAKRHFAGQISIAEDGIRIKI